MLVSYTLEVRDRRDGGNSYRIINNKTQKAARFYITPRIKKNGKMFKYLLDSAINRITKI